MIQIISYYYGIIFNSDASHPPASSGITKFFEKNEFFSSPELVTSAGSSNVDVSNPDQAQPQEGTRKRVVPVESAEPERRVTRAQSRRAYSDPGATSSPATSSKKRHVDDILQDSSEGGSSSTQTLPTLSMETWDREADEIDAKDVTIYMELDQTGQATGDAEDVLDQTGQATGDVGDVLDNIDQTAEATEDALVKERTDIKRPESGPSVQCLFGENTYVHTKEEEIKLNVKEEEINLKFKEEKIDLKVDDLPWGVLKLDPGSIEGVDIGIWSDSLTIGRSLSEFFLCILIPYLIS